MSLVINDLPLSGLFTGLGKLPFYDLRFILASSALHLKNHIAIVYI